MLLDRLELVGCGPKDRVQLFGPGVNSQGWAIGMRAWKHPNTWVLERLKGGRDGFGQDIPQ